MLEERLCWKCWESYRQSDPFSDIRKIQLAMPYLHCHHEPKEKPKCWCETEHHNLLAGMNVYLETSVVKINFCPKCGKKLGD